MFGVVVFLFGCFLFVLFVLLLVVCFVAGVGFFFSGRVVRGAVVCFCLLVVFLVWVVALLVPVFCSCCCVVGVASA